MLESYFDLKNENILDRVAIFFERVFEVLGSTEKETLTKFIFEIIIKSSILNETAIPTKDNNVLEHKKIFII